MKNLKKVSALIVAPTFLSVLHASVLASGDSPRLETIKSPLTAAKDYLWTIRNIPVCWENSSASNLRGREIVKQAATDTWQRMSAVTFTGWGDCSRNSKGIRIKIEDVKKNPHVDELGKNLNGKTNGMSLNFTFNNWYPYKNSPGSTYSTAKREKAIRVIAVHEFGHALGFIHEHNRHNGIAQGCKYEKQGPDANWWNDGWYVTPYDIQSVMNYCNQKYNNDGILSPLDVIGVQRMYGKPGTSGRDSGTMWFYSSHGTSPWAYLNSSKVGYLKVGDFDGNGVDDIFNVRGGKWYVSYGGITRWNKINNSKITDIKLGDFNGDGKTDVFNARGGNWYVSYSGTSKWQKINKSDITNVKLGDFNGDGKIDIFNARKGKFYVSYSGTGKWKKLNKSSVSMTNIKLADFNGDGKTDVFNARNGKWYVSYSGTGKWKKINTSNITKVYIGDFNGDNKADVMRRTDKKTMVSYGGTSRWKDMYIDSNLDDKPLRIGDFDGDGSDDVLVRWNGKL